MGVKKARRTVESALGYRLQNEVWDALVERYGEDPSTIDDDEELVEELVEYCVDTVRLLEKQFTQDVSAAPKLKVRPGKRGQYSTSFQKRQALYLFVTGQHLEHSPGRKAVFGEPGWKLSWENVYQRYKRAIDPWTGLPYEYVPATVDAFRLAYARAKSEWSQLDEEDMSDITVQTFLDAFDAAVSGKVSQRDAALVVIKRKQAGEVPEWRGKLTPQVIYRWMQDIVAAQAARVREERLAAEARAQAASGTVAEGAEPETAQPADSSDRDGAYILLGYAHQRYEEEVESRIKKLESLLAEYKDDEHQKP